MTKITWEDNKIKCYLTNSQEKTHEYIPGIFNDYLEDTLLIKQVKNNIDAITTNVNTFTSSIENGNVLIFIGYKDNNAINTHYTQIDENNNIYNVIVNLTNKILEKFKYEQLEKNNLIITNDIITYKFDELKDTMLEKMFLRISSKNYGIIYLDYQNLTIVTDDNIIRELKLNVLNNIGCDVSFYDKNNKNIFIKNLSKDEIIEIIELHKQEVNLLNDKKIILLNNLLNSKNVDDLIKLFNEI